MGEWEMGRWGEWKFLENGRMERIAEWENGKNSRMGGMGRMGRMGRLGRLGEKECILFTYYLLLITYYLNQGWGE